MNAKGQTTMLSVWFAIFIFLFGIVFINFLSLDVDTARTALSCSSASTISDGTKLTCLVVDIVLPYWILLILSVAGGLILDRLLI